MKPWTSWLARVGLAGACLCWVGCGGGGEESADPGVAAEGDPGVEGAVAGAMASQAAGQQGGTAIAAPDAAPEASAPAAAAPAPAAAANLGTGDPASGTAELLALANAPAPAAAAPEAAGGGPEAAGGGPVPGMPAGYGGPQGIPGGQGGPAGPPPGAPGEAGPAGYPGAPGVPGGGAPPGYPGASGPPAGYPGTAGPPPGVPGVSGPPPGYPGVPGGGGPPGIPGEGGFPGGQGGGIGFPGGPGGENEPANFQNPFTAVTSFLNAVRAKDADRLAEATALRAPTEASPSLRKFFTSIAEHSLSPEEFDQLAKALDGMQIIGQNDARSSARIGVTVGKTDETGDHISRTITVRREKAGWKVVDISGQKVLDNPSLNQGEGRGGRGR
ncbi:MAG: hypothetical protein AB7I30_09590 [Isosphaeraceae bacterium]